jgi:hypothetical protein
MIWHIFNSYSLHNKILVASLQLSALGDLVFEALGVFGKFFIVVSA